MHYFRNLEIKNIKTKVNMRTHRNSNTEIRHHQRHHQRQPSEHPFTIQVVTGCYSIKLYFYLFSILNLTRRTINNHTTYGQQNCYWGWGGSPGYRSTNPRPLFCLGSSHTHLFGLLGRFLAHMCIILET